MILLDKNGKVVARGEIIEVEPGYWKAGRRSFIGDFTLHDVVYKDLPTVGFFNLLLTAGGVTYAQIGEARANPVLAGLWPILDNAENVSLEDANTQAGLGALVEAGYLDEAAKDAVIAAWPTL